MGNMSELMAQTRHRISVADYHKMDEAGIFGEDSRVELIDGEIVDMAPIGSKHAFVVSRLARLFTLAARDDYLVSVHNPIRLDNCSEPQPDIALLKPGNYMDSLPGASDVLLIVEVAHSSISFDPKQQAEQLTMQGAVIPGQRGKNIRGYLQTTVNRLNLFSALFLAILAAVPTILTSGLNTQVPFAASSILIAVSVSLETIRAIRAEMSIRGIDSNLDNAGFM